VFKELLRPVCIPSNRVCFSQESAEEEQSSASSAARKRMPVITSNTSSQSSDSVPSVQGAAVTASSTDVKTVSSAPTSALCVSLSLMYLFLQPGHSFDLLIGTECLLDAVSNSFSNVYILLFFMFSMSNHLYVPS